MTYTYKLRFEGERQSEVVLGAAMANLKPRDVSIKTIGIHKEYTVNEDDPEAEPIVTVFEGWHVDIVSRVELVFDPLFLVDPKNPIHSFAGQS